MEPHQLLHEREPDPCALVAASLGSLDAVKALEEVWQLGGRNPGATIAYRELDVVAVRPQADGDLALKRELESVGEEVEDDLLPLRGIYVDRLRNWWTVDHELEPSPLDKGAEGARQRRLTSAPPFWRKRAGFFFLRW